ncbi:CHRD domain-containing protein [Eoetvoesiella sp.]|uniref:CHRD domain-containing protein n=1 Tax=Eoetvoesiella sp. TaxID=1966355 RepID=UPI0039C8B8B1
MRNLVTRGGLAAIASAAWLGLASAAMAAPVSFSVPLTGAQQVPPVQTAGSGKADITYDPATKDVTWSISFDGLSSPATMAHFHGPAAAGANAGVQVWLSKRGDAVSSPITGHATLTAEQDKQFEAGQWYVNIHTKSHPSGEIRGQVVPPKH